MKAKDINVDSSKQEITQNIPGFSISCYFSEFSWDTYNYIDWHWHVEFQLCVVTEGSIIWQIGPQQIIANRGEGIFINSQQVHMAKPYFCDNAAFFCVDFRPDAICPDKASTLYATSVLPILNNSRLHAKKLLPGEGEAHTVLEQLDRMSSLFSAKENGYEFDLVSALYLVWKNLQPQLACDAGVGSAFSDTRLKDILIFLQQNYSRCLSLDEIAASINLSRSECCRYFKKQTGQTIFEYLMQYRIHKSLDLLRNTDMEIARIAVESGFSNQSYYTSRFRGLIGMTPKQYRATTQGVH